MIRVIDERCPGDCSKCRLPNEMPGFDLYGCMLYQILQKNIKLERDIEQMKAAQASLTNDENKETTFTNPHQLEDTNDDTSDETLPQ